jgi:hypothetical protein
MLQRDAPPWRWPACLPQPPPMVGPRSEPSSLELERRLGPLPPPNITWQPTLSLYCMAHMASLIRTFRAALASSAAPLRSLRELSICGEPNGPGGHPHQHAADRRAAVQLAAGMAPTGLQKLSLFHLTAF